MGLSLRHLSGGLLRRESCADGFCQIEGRAFAPKVLKEHGEIFVNQMIVECHDMDIDDMIKRAHLGWIIPDGSYHPARNNLPGVTQQIQCDRFNTLLLNALIS